MANNENLNRGGTFGHDGSGTGRPKEEYRRQARELLPDLIARIKLDLETKDLDTNNIRAIYDTLSKYGLGTQQDVTNISANDAIFEFSLNLIDKYVPADNQEAERASLRAAYKSLKPVS